MIEMVADLIVKAMLCKTQKSLHNYTSWSFNVPDKLEDRGVVRGITANISCLLDSFLEM